MGCLKSRFKQSSTCSGCQRDLLVSSECGFSLVGEPGSGCAKTSPTVRLLGLSLGQRYTHKRSYKGELLGNMCDPETLPWETKG